MSKLFKYALFIMAPLFSTQVCQAGAAKSIRYIETHIHLHGDAGFSLNSAAKAAFKSMDKLGIARLLILPPPFHPDHQAKYNYKPLKDICEKYPDKLAFIGGGGELNPLIQNAVLAGKVTKSLREKFIRKAREIAKAGAVGYGEMAAEHFSFNAQHPYITAQPDHELFLLLADIGAEYNLPIDLHMEPVPHDNFPFPHDKWTRRSNKNPKFLKDNITRLERLLAHNRKANIIWVHIGWNHTGAMTPDLLRRLLGKHPNLYMSLKDHSHSQNQDRALDASGSLRSEWKKLIAEFPDKFMFGSDMFYMSSNASRRFPDSTNGSRAILNQLPLDLARKVAYENAAKLFKLNVDPASMQGDTEYQPGEPDEPKGKGRGRTR